MIEWPERVVRNLARRRTVVFVGAGVSKHARAPDGATLPSWEEFLLSGMERSPQHKNDIRALIKEGDFLSACGIIKRQMGENWNEFVREKLYRPGFQSSAIHEHIFKLDTKIIITPNFDKIYDIFAQQQSDGTVSVLNYSSEEIAEFLRDDSRIILKVHGSVDNISSMIFTREDYANQRVNHAKIHFILQSLFLNYDFLFLGTSFADPDFRLIAENYSQLFPGAYPNYIVLPKQSRHTGRIEEYKKSFNLRVLEYKKDPGHADLVESLANLVERVEAERSTGATG